MKKLLVAALLAVGATSFAAVTVPVTTGNESGVLPVVVKGNVVDATKLTMEITALDNAGPDGRSLTFNFGDLVKGAGKEDLVGTFRVRLLKNGASGIDEFAFDKAPKYTLLGGTNGDGRENNAEEDITTTNLVGLKYHLGSTKGTAGVTRNEEKLTVSADATSANVGAFTDSSIKIKVTLDNQVAGK